MSGLGSWLDRWGLVLDGAPLAPRYQGLTSSGEVAFVTRGAERLVLKLLPPGGDEARMAQVLAHWGGHGAVRVGEAAPGALLMERARPGDDLVVVLEGEGDDAATLAACDVMRKLNRPAPLDGHFRTIADWGSGFAHNREKALAVGFDPDLLRQAEQKFWELHASQAAPILLHGDLHHHNIVRDSVRGWLAIDPKGVLGEAAYETGALLRNPIETPALCALPEILHRRAELMARVLDLDVRRILGWAFAQWMLACLWAIQDGISFADGWLDGPRAAASLL